MTKKDLNNWIMYHELHRLKRFGFSNTKIAKFLVIDARTVSKYLNMTEEGYEHHLLQSCQRKRILSQYEKFVFERLSLFQGTSTAQIHDWLKEAHVDFPEVSPRTVYNFVMYVRHKYNIPFVRTTREYFPIEELPYGEQAQVDFGEYNMRTPSGQKKKVKFFAMVMSRSRMKYIWFLDKPFTSQTVSQAHENAFAFFGGMPKILVYDQDRTMVVDENLGDIILTSTFKQYTKSRNFILHFCRKADPESKGKVENVVQYVKKNFLYNRQYSDIQTLNAQAIAWLERTANHLPHNLTKISPKAAFMDEKAHLRPFTPLTIENTENKTYIVRKDNTVNYRSNFYTVPMGTYKAGETMVILKEKKNILEVYSINNELICSHTLSPGAGKIISNTSHKRDTSKTLEDMVQQVAECFTDQKLAMAYLQQIRNKLPRYTRDHLQVISKSLTGIDKETADKALQFCLTNSVLNGHDWTHVLQVFHDELSTKTHKDEITLLDKNNDKKVNQTPQTSSIDDYENIINPACR